MLYDEKISAPMNKQKLASIISHEVAHQWFGNYCSDEQLKMDKRDL